MDERRRRRNREGRGEPPRLNRWRRRLAESLPSPDRLNRAGMPSRDRGRRTEGNEDRRGTVAEVHFVDAGRPDERHTEARHCRVAGWRPDEVRTKL